MDAIEERRARQETLDDLRTPQRWPLYPHLPIKRRRPPEGAECATVHHNMETGGLLFVACSYDDGREAWATATKTAMTAEQIVAAGWVVD